MALDRNSDKVQIENPSSAIDSEVMVYGSDDGGTTPRVIRTDDDGSPIKSSPQGSGSDGSVALANADEWYQVPQAGSVPTEDYVLIVAFENALGAIRMSYDNGGVPSVTNGILAPNPFGLKLGAGEVIYFGSSTAGDDVNWTAKEIV